VRWRGALVGLSLPLGAAGCLAGDAVGYDLVGTSRRDALIQGGGRRPRCTRAGCNPPPRRPPGL